MEHAVSSVQDVGESMQIPKTYERYDRCSSVMGRTGLKNFLIRRIPQTSKLGLEEIKSLSCME
jgi:hypothetical protein